MENVFSNLYDETKLNLILNYENADIIIKFCSEYDMEQETAKEYFIEVKKFLFLCATTTDRLAPSAEIDKIWHTFILFTKEYRQFCMHFFGKFIDHVPEVKNDSKVLDKSKVNCLLNTIIHYESVFGKLNNDVWQISFKYEADDCSKPQNCSSCNNSYNNYSSSEGRGSQPSCVFTGNCFDCTDSGYSCVGKNPNDL